MGDFKIDQNEIVNFYEGFPCGLLVMNSKGDIQYANQILLDWLNATPEDLTSKNITELLDQGAKFYYQLFVQPSLNMHQAVKEIDLTIQTLSSSFSCLFSASVIKSKRGEELTSAAIYKITDRKKYETELLIQKNQSDVETLAKTNALQEIAFEQAHIVRAPLANMLGLISLLEQYDLSDEVKDLLSLLHTSTIQLDVQIKHIVHKINSNGG
jgi:sigma-B regulation protein RsbU (phosphoserine phosphatase)